jgi:hypothetical protein
VSKKNTRKKEAINKKKKRMTTIPIWMSDKRYTDIEKRIQESYPNACILYIDEVSNPSLLQKYQELKQKLGATEVHMFHGTKEETVPIIIRDGFDPSFNVRAAFGPGVYFAENAVYSSGYMSACKKNEPTYMFYADVLVGKDKIDNHRGPNILTTVHRYGSYPRYIVAFHKEAK